MWEIQPRHFAAKYVIRYFVLILEIRHLSDRRIAKSSKNLQSGSLAAVNLPADLPHRKPVTQFVGYRSTDLLPPHPTIYFLKRIPFSSYSTCL